MKNKTNRSGPGNSDNCQTPLTALGPIIPILENRFGPGSIIWESAAGEGNLALGLKLFGSWSVYATDIVYGSDYFELATERKAKDIGVAVQVTNPPFSLKYEWAERAIEIGIPFALLMPVEMVGTMRGQKWIKRNGIEIVYFHPRINFKMPYKGYSGGGSQFPVSWYTWGLELGSNAVYMGRYPGPGTVSAKGIKYAGHLNLDVGTLGRFDGNRFRPGETAFPGDGSRWSRIVPVVYGQGPELQENAGRNNGRGPELESDSNVG